MTHGFILLIDNAMNTPQATATAPMTHKYPTRICVSSISTAYAKGQSILVSAKEDATARL
jgi:hypothetical protein